jgi:hypothetical protein
MTKIIRFFIIKRSGYIFFPYDVWFPFNSILKLFDLFIDIIF